MVPFPRLRAHAFSPLIATWSPREVSQHAQHCGSTTLKDTARERGVLALDSLCVSCWVGPSLSKNRQKLDELRAVIIICSSPMRGLWYWPLLPFRHKIRVFPVNLQLLPSRSRGLPDPRNFLPQAGTALWKRNDMLATLRPAAASRFFTEPVFLSKCPERALM